MTRYTLFSGGEGSFRAAMIDRAQHPAALQALVFTDTLYEDADTYRFLIEAACMVFGRSKPNWLPSADDFPDYRVADDLPIEDYRGNPEWRAFLADLRDRATDALPKLVWLAEGRDPWEVYRDRRYLGNSRVDPCSDALKRKHLAKWQDASCTPGEDVFVVGIGAHEAHRFDDGEGHGYRPRMAARGHEAAAPLLGEITDPNSHARIRYAPLSALGIQRGRQYRHGYSHDNCGGFCCKGGIAHQALRYRAQPVRARYDAMMERKLRAWLGKDVSMLTDRRGGDKQPMTLDALHRRLDHDPQATFEMRPGESGCGCMVAA